MKEKDSISRRDFLKVSFAAGAGMLISIYLSGCSDQGGRSAGRLTFRLLRHVPEPIQPGKIHPPCFRSSASRASAHRSELAHPGSPPGGAYFVCHGKGG